MSYVRPALVSAALLLPAFSSAQTPQLPPGMAPIVRGFQQRCQAAGGQTVNGDRLAVIQLDVTNDGRPDFILDEGGFACSNPAVTSKSTRGAPFEIYDGATGQSLYRGVAQRLRQGRGASGAVALNMELSGPDCGPQAGANATCNRVLVWNPAGRQFVLGPIVMGGPNLAQGAPAGGRDPLAGAAPAPKTAAAPAPQAAPPATAGGAMTLSAADRTAVFRAANFVQQRGMWKGCVDDPSEYYRGGEISEVLDLNGDGRPEAVVAENSSFCHGQQGDWFAVLSKEANGSWRKVLETDGVFVALNTRANGWREIMVGGPGFEHGVVRYNGREYVFNRRMREPGG